MKRTFVWVGFAATCLLIMLSFGRTPGVLFAGETKERLVLLPIEGETLSDADKALFQNAVKEGLSDRYEIFSGEQVEAKLQKFAVTSCTSDECLENIAIAFNGNLVGRGSVTKEGDDAFLSIEIKDVITDKDVFTKTSGCTGCSKTEIMEKLIAMAGGRSALSSMGGAVEFASPAAPDKGPAEGGVTRITPKVSGDSGSTVAALFLDSEPSGAAVYLGDIVAGETPYQNLGLKAGQTVRIMLKKDDYHPQTLELKLSGGTNEIETVKLKPRFGSLSVTSEPDGAEVLLAGKKVGETPYNNSKVLSGTYLLSVRKELYAPVENQTIQILDEKATVKHLVLDAAFGTLSVASTPAGAQAEITRKSGKAVHEEDTPFSVRLSPGVYEVHLEKDGYDSVSYTVTVARNGQQSIDAAGAVLRRLEGTVIVSSDPYEKGAEVRVDGELKGHVPATLTVAAGEHEIAVKGKKLQGKQKVRVKDRETSTAQIIIKKNDDNQINNSNLSMIEDIVANSIDNLVIDETPLVLNGSGWRKKSLLKIYFVSLYLRSKTIDSNSIVNSDEPMMLQIKWEYCPPQRTLHQWFIESFSKVDSTMNFGSLENDIMSFIDFVDNQKLKRNDRWFCIYTPEKGMSIYIHEGGKAQLKITIPGIEFKKALFSIWIGDQPLAGDRLKNDLLGK